MRQGESTLSVLERREPSVDSTLLIKGGRVVDPANGTDEILDVLIQKGHIAQVGKNLEGSGVRTIDASGKVVAPGLIDVHVHLREPGREDKETIATGTRAAAFGGFTSIVAMANTHPPVDTVSQVKFVLTKAVSEGIVRVYPVGAVTKGLEGKELAELGAMKEAGAVAFSDDGVPVMNAQLLRRALEYAKDLGIPVIEHCEDTQLSAGGVMNEGYAATVRGLRGIPRQSETIMVARNIALAELTGGHLHVAHISTAEGVALVREAKKKGLRVTAEACPHHFCLTEEAVSQYNTDAKMNPPLRTAQDAQAIKQGLADGTIEVIASDHAPHTAAEKAQEFSLAPFGIIGLETTLPLVLTELVGKKVLSLSQAIASMTSHPARIFHLPGGRLSPGQPADIVVIDLDEKRTVQHFASKSKNSPFVGWTLSGFAAVTVVGGKIVQENGRLAGAP